MINVNYVGNLSSPSDEEKIAALEAALQEHTLDPIYETRNGFMRKLDSGLCEILGYGRREFPAIPVYRLYGNFANYSCAFSIDTDEPDLISLLVKKIRENTRSTAYASAYRTARWYD